MKKQQTGPGRPACDGATSVQRVNISLTKSHRDKLKELSSRGGISSASAWIRQAIDKAWKERK